MNKLFFLILMVYNMAYSGAASHAVAGGVGYAIGKTSSNKQIQNDVIYSGTATTCRCDAPRGPGCYTRYDNVDGKSSFGVLSPRAYTIIMCGAPRTVRVTKLTWTMDALFIEWEPR